MASIRRLPSGKYNARIVRAGRYVDSFTHPLESVVKRWARDVERQLDAGDWAPRAARARTVGEWHTDWLRSRLVSPLTADKNASQWRAHVEPRWADVPLDAVTRDDVRAWVAGMHKAGVGAHTIHACVHYLGTIFVGYLDGRGVNPAHGVSLPATDLRAPFYWSRAEAAAIVRELEPPWSTLVDLDMHVGLRLGELAGLRREAVDWGQGLIHVVEVMTRRGPKRYPKGRRLRSVPFPPHLADDLLELGSGDPDGRVWPGLGERSLQDGNFRRRIFDPAVKRAAVRRGTPHDMRHTAASWLVADGVDLYRVQALLGHESSATTMRYAHLAPDAFARVRASWEREDTPALGGGVSEPV